MTNNAKPQANEGKQLAAALQLFADKCRAELEERGLVVTHKDAKDRRYLGDIAPETFVSIRKECGIVMEGATAKLA